VPWPKSLLPPPGLEADDENGECQHQAHEESGGDALERQPADVSPFPAQTLFPQDWSTCDMALFLSV